MDNRFSKWLSAFVAVFILLISGLFSGAALSAGAETSPVTTLSMRDEITVVTAVKVPVIMYHSVSRGSPGK